MNKVWAIIVAAGEGKRFGAAKQFALLKGKALLDWNLEKFEDHEAIDRIVLVLGKDHTGEDFPKRYGKIATVAKGGEKRQDSVYSGLSCVDAQEAEIVLVHDGARPFVSKDLIDRVIDATKTKGAAIPVIPVEDTLKLVEGQKIVRTQDRKRFFRAQTPQGFTYTLLKDAFLQARRKDFEGTDEAALVENMGKDVFVIQGEPRNLKITTPDDFLIAEAWIED
jgi:2-C-methyl-D-erythritol 4-phosphate cytidylyltransferase